MDQTTQHTLTRWLKKETRSEEEYAHLLKDIKEGLGFSPLTGEIVAIGVLDPDKDKGVVYFSAPDGSTEDFEEDGFKYKVCTEEEMLGYFWEGAKKYGEFISFNGRGFDVPFLMVRSAMYGIRPTQNLMSYRYIESQKYGPTHVDLQDQLAFYGAMRRKGSLHLWTRAFGIKSPKEDGVTGDNVTQLYKEGRSMDIARYNARDLIATKELYEYWDKYMRF